MSTFSAHDQRRMSLFFAPFGYLVITSALTNSFHQLMPWRSFLLPKVDRSSVLKVTFIPRKMNVLAKIRYPGDVKCPAKLQTTKDIKNPELITAHCHPSDEVGVVVAKCRDEMAQKASTCRDKPNQIFTFTTAPVSDEAKARLPSTNTCKRQLR